MGSTLLAFLLVEPGQHRPMRVQSAFAHDRGSSTVDLISLITTPSQQMGSPADFFRRLGFMLGERKLLRDAFGAHSFHSPRYSKHEEREKAASSKKGEYNVIFELDSVDHNQPSNHGRKKGESQCHTLTSVRKTQVTSISTMKIMARVIL
jgi:hypothetical protein